MAIQATGYADGVDAERLQRSVAAVHRRRTELIPGGRVVDLDGLVVLVSGLPAPWANFCVVERVPRDTSAAVEAAEEVLADVGMPFGIDLPAGRFPDLMRAIRTHGSRIVEGRPIMTACVGDLPALAPPWEVEIDRVRTDEDLSTIADVDAEAFETDPRVSRGLYARTVTEANDVAALLARLDGEPVGAAFALRAGGTVAVFGVGVLPSARGRGIGGALTCAVARAVGLPDDIAWLFPSEGARALYERLGFMVGEPWEVWVS